MAGSLRGLKKFLTLFRAPKMEPPVSRQFHATTKAAERIPAAQRPSFRVVKRCPYSNPDELRTLLVHLLGRL
jgi:hypothetical protein